jgi:hypothetical protein
MRLSTLVLASAFAWVLTATAALADSEESAAAPDALSAEAPLAAEPDLMEPEAIDGAPAGPESGAPVAGEAPATGEGPVAGEAPAAGAAPAAGDAAWEDFADPQFDPTTSGPAVETPVASRPAPSGPRPALGPIAVNAKGVKGRIHTVVSGDTLWDISETYLGTPWVWPSVWDENDGVDNPHVIEPGDRIWISSNEMRIVTDAEAEQMIGAVPGGQTDEVVSDGETLQFEEEVSLVADEPLPAAVEDVDEAELPVTMPLDPMGAMTGEVITLPSDLKSHYATAETMEEAARIVDSPVLRAFLTQGDRVYLPLGEGEVSVGDEFTIFRDVLKIRDVDTGAVLGYHFDELGWLVIQAVEGESSIGVISEATSEMARQDRILQRERTSREIPVRTTSEEIEGRIVFTPGYRWLMGMTDTVILNVGSIHGVEVGTHMEAFQRGVVEDSHKMPDTVVAELVVTRVEPESSVAFVTQTVRELEIGDDVRSVVGSDELASH